MLLISLVSVIVISLYIDEFIVKGRLVVALLFTGLLLISTFILNPNRLERRFLFMWVIGLVGLLLFSFAWGLNENQIPFWPSGLIFQILTIVELAPFLSTNLNDDKARALFHTHLATVVLFAFLVTDGKIAYNANLTVLVYGPIGLFVCYIGFAYFIRRTVSTSLVLSTMMVLATYILAARKWTGQSNVLWLLIVQPLVGLLFIDLLDGYTGRGGRLISSTGNKKM